MPKDPEISDHMQALPTEILLFIFALLPAKSLIRCRQVCSRWKQIVDRLIDPAISEARWFKFCKRDFKNVYQVARYKSRPGLFWMDIYRSLCLWSRLGQAREISDEFASASTVTQEIKGFSILRDGIIGVHKRGSIVYYDLATMEVAKRSKIDGSYFSYTEDDNHLIILGHQLHLYIIKKSTTDPDDDSNTTTFDNVKLYLLTDAEVYFVTLNNEIFKVELNDTFEAKLMKVVDDSVMTLSHVDGSLYILTFHRDIFKLTGEDLEFVCELGPDSNLLHQLHQYNLLEHLDWRTYFQWMFVLNHRVPQGPLQDIITIRAYGDVFFVGSNWGVVRIYYAPYSSTGQLDIFNAEPIKQYNFMERHDCPVLSMCPIIQIDVVEARDGHTVAIAMPKKVAILNFVHNFKRTASFAMLPYSEGQKIKAMKRRSSN